MPRRFRGDPEKYVTANQTSSLAEADTARRIAYFSMEVAVDARMPSYSGGLGVLAGDTLRSAADLKIPMVAVTLLPANGYFDQKIDERAISRNPQLSGIRPPWLDDST